MVLGFHNERIRKQLGELLQEENDQLTKKLAEIRERSPIDGISAKTWSILLNAVVDGLAIQALLSEDFPTEEVYPWIGETDIRRDGGRRWLNRRFLL